jgi:outer membrane protein, multidrug efflux system
MKTAFSHTPHGRRGYLFPIPVIGALWWAGCAQAFAALPTPNPAEEITVPSAFKGALPSRPELAAGDKGTPWWGMFADPVLDRLEDQAVQSNQDLQAAISRVSEARAAASEAAADLYPKVSAPLEASRQHTTNTGPVTTSRLVGSGFGPGFPTSFAGQALQNTYSDFQAPLTVGYEIDVFGRVAHAHSQARANADASLADREGVRLSLTSQVAANYFALRAADSAVAVLQRTAGLRTDAEQIQGQRLKAGSATDVDLLRAKVESANTQADLADAVQERAELENALAELCGQSASTFHLDARPLDLQAPPPVPVTVPAQLLSQRPDLVEAELRVAAANEGVKAARAEFYPAISLQGGYGFESSQDNQLLENQSHTWSIAGAINIPIFDGGRNSADLRLARSKNDEAIESYRATALRAFREVEDALSALRQRAAQAEARMRAADDARRVYEASQRSYTDGGLSYFEVIDSQRVLLSAELAQVRTLSGRYAATVDLVRATGGGFGGIAGEDK